MPDIVLANLNYNAFLDSDHRLRNLQLTGDLQVDGALRLGGVDVVTALLLASGQVVDLNGEADALILDAAQVVRLDGSSAGKMRIKISGAYDFEVLANIFRAIAGSVIEVDVINETTSAAGVTIDSVLLKDGASYGTRAPQALTASGAITVGKHGLVTLAHATVIIAATLAAPAAGYDLVITNTSASGTVAHTVTLPAGVTWDGTNNTATLDAAGEALHVVAVSATRWLIIDNIGSVGLSTV